MVADLRIRGEHYRRNEEGEEESEEKVVEHVQARLEEQRVTYMYTHRNAQTTRIWPRFESTAERREVTGSKWALTRRLFF